ncbi:hypothetical protein [Hymenobacter fodinae]|uniref:Uncharacterized protein n=1 Tax=Hymenobacter fodinae TaxID=2510796 RepID=A0A4Z0P0C9_9BACT|nr:hypothetical protein [Hymenobacter fodinae]TGE03846.1 hypothetical protein EU556_24885 [Hymenobacter fodinae]
MFKKMNLDHFFTLLGLIATAGALWFSSQNIRDTEKWKKGEFIVNQYEKFASDTAVIFAIKTLDYQSRFVNKQLGIITRDKVTLCLQPKPKGVDMKLNAMVRANFDQYLDKLSLFNRYEQSGLMTKEDIEPYIKYHIKLIAGPTEEENLKELQHELWGYIDRYEFNDVKQLCFLFGHDITVIDEKNK